MDREKVMVWPFHLIIDGEGIELKYGNGKEIFIAVATSLILFTFAKKRKKNHSSSQDRSGSSLLELSPSCLQHGGVTEAWLLKRFVSLGKASLHKLKPNPGGVS
ncbi:hypothetical protein V3595_02040 [Bacillus sp. CFBP9009]